MVFTSASEADFTHDVLGNALPVLVKFSASWCSPCKVLAPVIESVASDYADEISFVAVDIDVTPQIAQDYGVRGVPTLLLFRDGVVVERAVGPQSRTQLAMLMDKALGRHA